MIIQAQQLPSTQYGYYLPIYSDCDIRTIRKLVLRAFRDLVAHKKYGEGYDLLRVKNFKIITKDLGGCPPVLSGSFAWKCDLVLARSV